MGLEIKEIKAAQTWDLRHRIMWPNQPFDFVKLKHDDQGLHYAIKRKDKILSVISLFIENGKAQFRKLATEFEEQKKGHATRLIMHVIDIAKEHKLESIWCNARVNKTAFYEKFGLLKTDKFYTKGGIDFVILEKQL